MTNKKHSIYGTLLYLLLSLAGDKRFEPYSDVG
jgi:hypothetical protein